MTYREPPQNLEVEAALLGCMIQEPDTIDDVSDYLREEDFYSSMYGCVYGNLVAMRDLCEHIDRISIVEHLRRAGKLTEIGGPQMISQLLESIPTAASVEYYARVISDLATYRRVSIAGSDIAAMAYNASEGAEHAISDAMRRLDEAARGVDHAKHVDSQTALAHVYNIAFQQEGRLCVQTPFAELNEKIGGFYPGEMYVWAGAPKAGKTNLELTLASHVANEYGQVAVFAIEMGQIGFMERRFAMESGVTVKQQRGSALTFSQKQSLSEALGRLSEQPMEVYDRNVRSMASIRRALRRLRRNGPIKSIFIDHVGMLEEVTAESRNSTKSDRLERVYNDCIRLASEFECPIHVIQHINREGQKSARPTMSDIRDGGNPEGLAAGIFLVHREDPMNLDNKAHLGEIIIANTRNGETDIIMATYNGARGIWQERTPFNATPYSFR